MGVDDVNKIADDFWEYRLITNPSYATYHGRNEYNDRMESYAIEQFNQSRISILSYVCLFRLEARYRDIGHIQAV